MQLNPLKGRDMFLSSEEHTCAHENDKTGAFHHNVGFFKSACLFQQKTLHATFTSKGTSLEIDSLHEHMAFSILNLPLCRCPACNRYM